MARNDFDFWEALDGREVQVYFGSPVFIKEYLPNDEALVVDQLGRELSVPTRCLKSASPEELEGFGA